MIMQENGPAITTNKLTTTRSMRSTMSTITTVILITTCKYCDEKEKRKFIDILKKHDVLRNDYGAAVAEQNVEAEDIDSDLDDQDGGRLRREKK